MSQCKFTSYCCFISEEKLFIRALNSVAKYSMLSMKDGTKFNAFNGWNIGSSEILGNCKTESGI